MTVLPSVTALDGCTVSDTLRVDCAPVVHVKRRPGAELSARASTEQERATVTLTAICALLDPADATAVAATLASTTIASAFVTALNPDNSRRICINVDSFQSPNDTVSGRRPG
jgi:hypothetical protein